MRTQMMSKPQLQEIVRGLRAADYDVVSSDSGYTVALDGVEIFRAMNGTRNYLVRYDERLLTPS